MARTQELVESITCDLCGRPAQEDLSVVLGWDGEEWRLDLCPTDYKRVAAQFDKWIANSEPAPRKQSAGRARRSTRTKRTNGGDEWTYLESLGFKRHRGRKNAAEVEALTKRLR